MLIFFKLNFPDFLLPLKFTSKAKLNQPFIQSGMWNSLFLTGIHQVQMCLSLIFKAFFRKTYFLLFSYYFYFFYMRSKTVTLVILPSSFTNNHKLLANDGKTYF